MRCKGDMEGLPLNFCEDVEEARDDLEIIDFDDCECKVRVDLECMEGDCIPRRALVEVAFELERKKDGMFDY